ncbi:hypothetical protein EV127DRAFT_413791 [Xylaria flabelliformis]|nr:hypothetical protein EV127DRAFT_413791 [Xylaria flabelliformis]
MDDSVLVEQTGTIYLKIWLTISNVNPERHISFGGSYTAELSIETNLLQRLGIRAIRIMERVLSTTPSACQRQEFISLVLLSLEARRYPLCHALRKLQIVGRYRREVKFLRFCTTARIIAASAGTSTVQSSGVSPVLTVYVDLKLRYEHSSEEDGIVEQWANEKPRKSVRNTSYYCSDGRFCGLKSDNVSIVATINLLALVSVAYGVVQQTFARDANYYVTAVIISFLEASWQNRVFLFKFYTDTSKYVDLATSK